MKEDVKNIILAAVGTGASFGLAQISLVLSVVAAVLTIIFTALRIYDWVEARVERKRQGK